MVEVIEWKVRPTWEFPPVLCLLVPCQEHVKRFEILLIHL